MILWLARVQFGDIKHTAKNIRQPEWSGAEANFTGVVSSTKDLGTERVPHSVLHSFPISAFSKVLWFPPAMHHILNLRA